MINKEPDIWEYEGEEKEYSSLSVREKGRGNTFFRGLGTINRETVQAVQPGLSQSSVTLLPFSFYN